LWVIAAAALESTATAIGLIGARHYRYKHYKVPPARPYIIVSGSQRLGSQSLKVATFIAAEMAADPQVASTYLLDLAAHPLELWDETERLYGPETYPSWFEVAPYLSRADGIVIVTPEWDGMASPAIKNLMLHCSREEVGHKPCLIVAVSASGGGSAPVNELRASSYKNNRICYIPDQLVVRDVNSVLNGRTAVGSRDIELRSRVGWTLQVLYRYADALAALRRNPILFSSDYANGM
jgi:NAD(P)H-dependent FMN reductase